jgi:EAL domain-containing protein (putative c-di-GMP-specific phosphodiesterase class I)/CHASE2 domain-containing sensor protein
MGGKKIISGRLRRLWRDGRVRILFWCTLVALIFGAVEIGHPVERALLMARNAAHPHAASGNIVIVGIDDKSLQALPETPWPRTDYAKLIDGIRELGARHFYYDMDTALPTQPKEDRALADALKRFGGRATIAMRFVIDPVSGKRTDSYPRPSFRKYAGLANINVRYRAGAVWEMPYGLDFTTGTYRSMAAVIAGADGRAGEMFPIDLSIDPRSIPHFSAIDIINRRVPPGALLGKDVLVGPTSMQLGDIYMVPGRGQMGGVYLHALGAETLRSGRPVDLSWPFPLLAGLLAAAACLWARSVQRAVSVATVACAAFLFVPVFLELHHIFVEIVPALILLLGSAGTHAWRSFRRSYSERGSINPVSGLPNLNALRKETPAAHAALIAARVQNYAQVCAALQTDEERSLATQIASRLTVGADATTVYQGDEGIFAWFAPEEADLEEHLNALHALFRSAVAVADSRFDLTVTFGVDTGTDRSIPSRLGGALSAADEAAGESRKWKRYDPGTGDDAAWRLSILSQLDAAIGAGDLWVAYQPKYDVKTKLVVGAEALARWTHPTKGAISPMEFIPAAEQSGRIEKLTEFVLDRAIRACSLAIKRNPNFNMAVNLSPKLLGSFPLEERVVALLAEYQIPAECLTLEVTETAALARGEADLAPLHRLRARGVKVSIDDYGTGLSTLDYIKRLPATEIKIDKSFVQAVGKSRSDRLMVHSTIQLAHSLGHIVVAEGVEDLATFEALAAMGCDQVQGFYFAKPMIFSHLTPLIPGWRKAAAA